MGEEAAAFDYVGNDVDDEGRVLEWEIGLPSGDDLTPLSQTLVPPELAAAFSITMDPPRTMMDVHRASHNTLSSLRGHNSSCSPSAALKAFLPATADDPMVLEPDDPASGAAAEPSRKIRRPDPASSLAEEAESSALRTENSNDDIAARTLKRPRLVWTPQLHKRFVDVVAHLGINNAVPKTIMQLMNVEGLTRENVASHLQKYRLYLKRMQGRSDDGPSSSDHLFASTPVPQSLRENPPPAPPPHPVPLPMPSMPMPYAVPTMIPMPMFNMAQHHGHGSPVGMVPVNNHQSSPGAYHGFDSHHSYGGFGERPKDWGPGGNSYRPIISYPRVTPNDK